jgi:hypothetical protein
MRSPFINLLTFEVVPKLRGVREALCPAHAELAEFEALTCRRRVLKQAHLVKLPAFGYSHLSFYDHQAKVKDDEYV